MSLVRPSASSLGRIGRPLVLTTVWIVAAIWWGRVWAFPVMAADDLFFMTRNDVSPGQLTPRMWWQNLWADLLRRNGRTADVGVQLVFDRGPWFTRIAMAGACWGLSLMIWLWVREFIPPRVRRSPRGQLADGVALVGALLLPTALSFWDRRLDSTTLFFMAATWGYLGGLLLFLACTLPWLRELRGQPTSGWVKWGTLPLMLLTVFHHEILGVMAVGFGLTALACWRLTRWSVSEAVILTLFVVLGVVRMAAPGLRGRQIALDRGRGHDPLYLERSVSALAHFQERNLHYVLLLTAALLLVGVANLARGAAHRLVTVAAMTALALSCLGWCWLGDHTLRAMEDVDWHGWFRMPTGWPLMLFAGILWLAGVLIALGSRPAGAGAEGDAPWPILVPFTLVFCTAPIPFMLGSYFDRPLFFVYAMILATVLCAVVWVLATGTRRLFSLTSQAAGMGLVLTILVPGAVSGYRAWSGLQENHQVWLEAERQLVLAQEGRLSTVELPRRMPRRDYCSDWPGGRDAMLYRFGLLYRLDEDVTIRWRER